jgi:hypothetical protein
LQDIDGKRHLNYFAAMAHQAAPPPPSRPEQATEWKRAHLEVIRQNINQLTAMNQEAFLRRATKWKWFEGQFRTATDFIPD